MPGRQYYAGGSYRYGFNGKENDNEVKGKGNQQDYGMRINDPRLGRFLSVDPITRNYPQLTPYQFASNRPIDGIDLDGKEYLNYNSSMYRMGSYTKTEYTVSGYTFSGPPITTEEYTAYVVYENIPSSLKDSKNRTFKYVDGGPITTLGRDYTGEELSKIAFNRSQYFHARAQFYGASESDPPPAPIGQSQIDPTVQKGGGSIVQAWNSSASVLGPNGLGGMVLNQINTGINNAFAKESNMRGAFYNATNVVNAFFNNFGWKKEFDANNIKAANLINFVTDGSLDISGIANCSGTQNSQDRKNIYYNALFTAWEGSRIIQWLNQNDPNISVRDKTQKNIAELLKKYKAEGGGNEFDNINQFYKPKKNK